VITYISGKNIYIFSLLALDNLIFFCDNVG